MAELAQLDDESVLWRWVQAFRIYDEPGCPGWANSSTFSSSSDDTPMSTVEAAKWAALGLGVGDFVAAFCPECFVMQFTVADAKACGLQVMPDPEPNPDDPLGHTYVAGPRRALRRLKRYAVWLLPPESYVPGTYPPGHVNHGELTP